jgi:hypothetical protein
MPTLERYINNNITLPHLIEEKPGKSLGICIVIPCYNEPELLETLNSLSSCTPPKCNTEVIVVLNSSEDSPKHILANNKKTLADFNSWKLEQNSSCLNFHIIEITDLPKKHAGAGRARKIGMDEAIRRFKNVNKEEGIIISLDADCLVQKNYIAEIENSFLQNPNHNFFTISFAHPTNHADISNELREGITLYELYMRYYMHALKYSGFPHAIYSLGSCFAVKASAYVKQGGMNSRKAGEDFYFLQKMVSLGGNYGEITTTTVIPATRISDRVPFGTGPVLKRWTEGDMNIELTYNFRAFEELKSLFSNVRNYYSCSNNDLEKIFKNLHPSLCSFIEIGNTLNEILSIRNNCSDVDIFEKRFFHHINAFWILKYLNYSHQNYFKKEKLTDESIKYLQKNNYDIPIPENSKNLLHIYRYLDNSIDI